MRHTVLDHGVKLALGNQEWGVLKPSVPAESGVKSVKPSLWRRFVGGAALQGEVVQVTVPRDYIADFVHSLQTRIAELAPSLREGQEFPADYRILSQAYDIIPLPRPDRRRAA